MSEEKLSSQGLCSKAPGPKPPFPPHGPGPKPPYPQPGPGPKPPYPSPGPGTKPPYPPGPEPKPPYPGPEPKPPYPPQPPCPRPHVQSISEVITMKACETVNYHKSKVSVPVEIEPFATVGQITTRCNGAPIITPGEPHGCEHSDHCCKFVITQEVTVAIPIAFGARTAIGDEIVECMLVTNDENELG